MSIQHVNAISNRLSLRPPAVRFAGDSGLRVRDGLTLPVCVRARTGRDGRRSAAMERNEHVTRFLHIGDQQLGITRHFFSEGV